MRVLIVKCSSLGDIIHAFPTIALLRHREPDCLIDWVVERPFADLLLAHPGIDNVLTVETKAWRKRLYHPSTWQQLFAAKMALSAHRYDLAFDLQGNTKSGLILSQVDAKRKVGFDRNSVAEWPNLLFTNCKVRANDSGTIGDEYLSVVAEELSIPIDDLRLFSPKIELAVEEEEKELVDSLFFRPESYDRPILLISPGSNWENKRMSRSSLQELVRKIHRERGDLAIIYSWGNDRERELCEALSREEPRKSLLSPKLRLPALQLLMRRASALFAMDSLPLHLAATTETATVSLFGPSSSKKYAPKGTLHRSIQGSCPYGKLFDKRCPILRHCATGACLKNIEVDVIFREIDATIPRRG